MLVSDSSEAIKMAPCQSVSKPYVNLNVEFRACGCFPYLWNVHLLGDCAMHLPSTMLDAMGVAPRVTHRSALPRRVLPGMPAQYVT